MIASKAPKPRTAGSDRTVIVSVLMMHDLLRSAHSLSLRCRQRKSLLLLGCTHPLSPVGLLLLLERTQRSRQLQLRAGQCIQCTKAALLSSIVPNIAMVLPVLVKTPHPVTFCRVRLFCTAERKSPAPPETRVDRTEALMASFG